MVKYFLFSNQYNTVYMLPVYSSSTFSSQLDETGASTFSIHYRYLPVISAFGLLEPYIQTFPETEQKLNVWFIW